MTPKPSLDRLRLTAGTVLFAAGDVGAAAYLVERGRIEIFLPTSGGDMVLACRGPGEIVGEMAMLDRGPRSASARVVEDCSLIVVTEEQIAHRISETDPILRMCLGVVIERYRETVAALIRHRGDPVLPPERPSQARRAATLLASAIETLVLERELKTALDQGELELFFQPIVRLGPNTLAGLEALMRWNHPQRGLIAPGVFIPVAEASGLIADLTGWALAEVGRVFPEIMQAALQNAGATDGPLFLSVNVSGHDLARASFVPELTELVARTGIAPSSLKLEVTESVLMKDPERVAATLAACRVTGMGVAIDDFGTGYSSLSYLSSLPISTLKIDRAFVRAMLVDPTSRKIVQMVLRLADELGIPVIAEGIEEAAEADALALMSCAFGQGFHFARPAPLSEVLDLIRTWEPSGATALLEHRLGKAA